MFTLFRGCTFHCTGLLKDAKAGSCCCACITGVQAQSNTGLMFRQRPLFISDPGDPDQLNLKMVLRN